MSLGEYQKKRRFHQTSEPTANASPRTRGRPIFVVQLHHASHRHYDFRLQVGDALRSWAVPKGPSFDPSVKRLAAEVEDHPLAYAGFEGVIPHGQYGAGHVAVFDHGVWSSNADADEQLRKGHLRFELFGNKLKGGWHLIRTRRGAAKPQWLLVKEQDEYASRIEADDLLDDMPTPTAGTSAARAKRAGKSTAKPTATASKKPSAVAAPASKQTSRRARIDWAARALKLDGARRSKLPTKPPELQLATLVSTPPIGPQWLHEIKWDGYRITAMVRAGRVSLWSRNGLDWTGRLPELVAALAQLGLDDALFDGELIAGQGTKDDFNLLQATLSGERTAALTLVLFDLLHVNGVGLTRCALRERKQLLQQLLARPPRHLAYSAHGEGDGANAFAVAAQQGYEGIISKRADRVHVAGRSADWSKSKQLDSEEFAVVGVTPAKGSRTGFGALLLARHDRERGWVYAGKVGSGFSDKMLADLAKRIGSSGTATPTVSVPANDTDLRHARWFQPKFVVEVHSRGLGGNGLLRQPSVKAVRLDKAVRDLVSATGTSRTAAPTPRRQREHDQQEAVTLTHPERVVFPKDGYTKQQVADYYTAVMPWLLRAITGRPLSLIRCPGGIDGQCFFQKHEISGVQGVDRVRLKEGSGVDAEYLVVRDAAAVRELVQFNALEFHPWGAQAGQPDDADMIVFDLDPGPQVNWNAVRAAARKVRDLLAAMKLRSFVRTSGGKGLHVVVPLNPAQPWPEVKHFAQSVAQALSAHAPDKFVASASKSLRSGRIFIDWLRNARGATSVASYSLRARDGAPVAMPLSWTELPRVSGAAMFTIANVPKRLARTRRDPWQGFHAIKQRLPKIEPAPANRRGRKKQSASSGPP